MNTEGILDLRLPSVSRIPDFYVMVQVLCYAFLVSFRLTSISLGFRSILHTFIFLFSLSYAFTTLPILPTAFEPLKPVKPVCSRPYVPYATIYAINLKEISHMCISVKLKFRIPRSVVIVDGRALPQLLKSHPSSPPLDSAYA